MTGQVKEEILTRLGELGVHVEAGALHFDPVLLPAQELLTAPTTFTYVDISGAAQTLTTPANAVAFTLCQTPIILQHSPHRQIEIVYADGRREQRQGNRLDQALSAQIFARSGAIQQLVVHTPLAH
jgi:hypothetical protein